MDKKIREFVFLRGPYDGWTGDFLDVGQTSVPFGEPQRYNDIYERQEKDTRDGKVRFIWNATLSKAMWRDWAIDNDLDPDMLEQKPTVAKDDGSVEAADGRPRVRVEIKKNDPAKRWELWLMNKYEAEISYSEIGPPGVATADDFAKWMRDDLGIAR